MALKLQDRWALITGSTRGIGQQIALGLAEQGCNIIVHGRKLEHTQHTITLLKPYAIKTFAVAGVLGDARTEHTFIKQIFSKIGYVDILYNNAAVMNTWHDDVFKISMDEWENTFAVNFFAMVRICNWLIPTMLKRNWGRVVNLSSGIKDIAQLAPYSVSKAAVNKYTKDLAAQLAKTNVLVNALNPGWLKTDMGGADAQFAVEAVLPGAIIPVLLADFSKSGIIYNAQEYKYRLT